MNTLEATTPAVLRTATVAQDPAKRGGAPRQILVDGYTWHVQDAYGDLLERVPAKAWHDLAGRPDMTLIKENGDRQVWRVRRAAGDVFVKISFVDGTAARIKRCLRGPACLSEWRAAQYARKFGIPTVEPVANAYPTRRCGGARCMIATAAALNVSPLNEYWNSLQAPRHTPEGRRRVERLIAAVGDLIAMAHQSGFRHVDLHPENLLVECEPVSGEMTRVLFVDLQNVQIGRPVADRDVVHSLAQLNQWFRRHATVTDRIRFLRRYLQTRADVERATEHGRRLGMDLRQLVHALDGQAWRHAQQIYAKRDRRAMRSNRYFAKIRLPGGWRAHVFLSAKRAADEATTPPAAFTVAQWRQWLASPAKFGRAERPDQLLKDSHSGLVVRRELPAEPRPIAVVCKRPKARNWRRRLSMLFSPSRPMRGWRIGNALINRDLPTARPLAAVERRWLGLRLDSLLITEAIPDGCDMDVFLSQRLSAFGTREQRRTRDELIVSVCELLKRMQARGFVHWDFKAGNVFVHQTKDGQSALHASLVDLDGIAMKPDASDDDMRRAVARLGVSCEPYADITLTDRLRFLKLHLSSWGSDEHEWKAAWRELAVLCEAKRQQHATHQAWKLQHYGRT